MFPSKDLLRESNSWKEEKRREEERREEKKREEQKGEEKRRVVLRKTYSS